MPHARLVDGDTLSAQGLLVPQQLQAHCSRSLIFEVSANAESVLTQSRCKA